MSYVEQKITLLLKFSPILDQQIFFQIIFEKARKSRSQSPSSKQ